MNYIARLSPAFFLGGTVIAVGIKMFLERSRVREVSEEEEEVVIFFPEEVTDRTHSKIRSLVSRIRRTERSLDLCLFIVTYKPLADAVITLHQTGVKVRLMVDVSNIGCMGCQVDRIRRSGVSVMVRRQTGLMHHKFILMDEATVMTGSFNWTRQAVENNNENIVITNRPSLVTPFKEEFNKLWSENKLYSIPAGASEDIWD